MLNPFLDTPEKLATALCCKLEQWLENCGLEPNHMSMELVASADGSPKTKPLLKISIEGDQSNIETFLDLAKRELGDFEHTKETFEVGDTDGTRQKLTFQLSPKNIEHFRLKEVSRATLALLGNAIITGASCAAVAYPLLNPSALSSPTALAATMAGAAALVCLGAKLVASGCTYPAIHNEDAKNLVVTAYQNPLFTGSTRPTSASAHSP